MSPAPVPAPGAVDIAETRDLQACLALRLAVFVDEQGVPEAEERDALDADAIHFLARMDGLAVGTARIVLRGREGKIGRVCVLAAHRGTGLGVALIGACLARLAATPGVEVAVLGAQTGALGFYERLGFTAEGPVFLDAGIEHRSMRRPLAAFAERLAVTPPRRGATSDP